MSDSRGTKQKGKDNIGENLFEKMLESLEPFGCCIKAANVLQTSASLNKLQKVHFGPQFKMEREKIIEKHYFKNKWFYFVVSIEIFEKLSYIIM